MTRNPRKRVHPLEAERHIQREPLTAREINNFWRRVEATASLDKCWYWKGYIQYNGYGQVALRYSTMPAHRVAFYLGYGYWPNHCLHLHTCKRHCCNPKHLRDGTAGDNMRDPVSPYKYPRWYKEEWRL